MSIGGVGYLQVNEGHIMARMQDFTYGLGFQAGEVTNSALLEVCDPPLCLRFSLHIGRLFTFTKNLHCAYVLLFSSPWVSLSGMH